MPRSTFALAARWVAFNRIPLLLATWLFALAPVQGAAFRDSVSDNALFAALNHWDGRFYVRISQLGYDNVPDAWGHQDTNFWPLFPWLWRLFHLVIPSWAVSGFVLNLVLLTVAVASIYDIALKILPRETARLAPLLFLCHPFSFYYSAYYTEAAFVCFSALSLALAYRRLWALAALAAGIAGASRMVGLAAGIAVVVAYAESIEFDVRRIDKNVLWLPLVGLGTVTYVTYLALKFHDPFAFTAGLSAPDWGKDVTLHRFVHTVKAIVDPEMWPLHWLTAVDAAHFVILATTMLVAALGLPRLRPSLAAFTIVALLLSCRYWTNAGRYCAPIFPVTFILARWLKPRPNARLFVLTLGVMGSAVVAWLYVHDYWVS